MPGYRGWRSGRDSPVEDSGHEAAGVVHHFIVERQGVGLIGLDLTQGLAVVDVERGAEFLGQPLHRLVAARTDHVDLADAAVALREMQENIAKFVWWRWPDGC